MYLIIQEGTGMNVFRTTIAAGLIFLATPAHGMWQSIKDTVAPQQGLSLNTQRIIAAAAAVALVDAAIATPLIDWSAIIANSSHSILLRAAFLINAAAIPVMFWNSLQKNPDFWNREGLTNRMFLAINSMISLNAIRLGLTAANIMQ